MLEKIKYFLNEIMSFSIAILRLLFWLIILFFSGLQKILFCRVEICNIELRGLPLRCDREEMYNNLSYVDKLRVENPDLADLAYEEDEEYPIDENEDEEE